MQITLHLGFEKTATSLIQKQLKQNQNVYFIGHDVKVNSDLDRLNKAWNNFVITDFKSEKKAKSSKSRLFSELEAFSLNSRDAHLIISDERPTSLFDFDAPKILANLADVILVLKNCSVNRLVLTERSMASWIVSHMSYHYLNWWLTGINTIDKLMDQLILGDKFALRVANHFAQTKRLLSSLFPNAEVKSIQYEVLENQPEEWARLVEEYFYINLELQHVNQNKVNSDWRVNKKHLFRRGLKRKPFKTGYRKLRELIDFSLMNHSTSIFQHEFRRLEEFLGIFEAESINIIGSGSNKNILGKRNGNIFVNTSFTRLKKYRSETIKFLFLTEGYFHPEVILAASGTPELKKIRREKIAAIKDLRSDNIITISKRKKADLLVGLKTLNIRTHNLIVISPRSFYKLLLQVSCRRKKFYFANIFAYLTCAFFNRKPRPSLRPSSGLCAALIFKYGLFPTKTVDLDGIFSELSFYGKDQNKYKLKSVHDDIDRTIIRELF